MADSIDTSALLNDYLEDARTHLDTLDSALLEIERDLGTAELDRELANTLLRALHTLKGNSGMMGFTALQKFVHQFEGVFKRLLDDPTRLTQDHLNSLFESATLLRTVVENVAAHPHPDLSQETAFLESLAAGKQAGKGPRQKASKRKGARPDSEPERRMVHEEIAPHSAAGGVDMPFAVPAKTNVLKVDFERLDHLLNLAGELVIHKTKLNQIVKNLEDLVGAEEFFGELPGLAQMIEKTSGEIQEAIMRARMLPIQQVFHRFPRMVRDLARQKGKEVELTFSGEGTEIDKTVIDALGEPLIHLIRNSIDHGIEPPEARVAAGKERAGNIHLSAKQESNHIVISVRDDGAGMNGERIRKRAIEKGLITKDQPLSEDDIYGLVFTPGFSTAEQVSETSGRGVGLDVVKKVISDFNGIIEVRSAPGMGAEFTLKMPLTLAIIPSLLVETSGELYAVPLTAVIECVKTAAPEIHRADGREVVQLRGSVLPVKRLGQVLGRPKERKDFYYMVVLGRAEKRMGLLVDRLRGQQEVVIKALDDYLGDAAGISGATILGDGSVVLIVDTAKIM